MEMKNIEFTCSICGTQLESCDCICQNCSNDLDNELKIQEFCDKFLYDDEY